jgi:hypothetical protein
MKNIIITSCVAISFIVSQPLLAQSITHEAADALIDIFAKKASDRNSAMKAKEKTPPAVVPEKVLPPEVPEDKFDLRGLFLGMSKEDLGAFTKAAYSKQKVISCSKLSDSHCSGDTACQLFLKNNTTGESITIAGQYISGETNFILKNDKVVAFSMRFASDFESKIVEAFTKKYGKPKYTKKIDLNKAYKKRYGASPKWSKSKATKNSVLIERAWEIKDAQVTIYSTNASSMTLDTTLEVKSQSQLAQIQECKRKNKERAEEEGKRYLDDL